jgi:N-acetylglucosaminyl-diphospho-decaprenol L-rhamnosyltransferase
MVKKQQNADVSAVVVTYQTGPILFECIDSLLSQSELRQLILVNNGNPLEVEARLRSLAALDARIELVSGHGNIGFAAACNLGVAQARGDILLLLNPDCVMHGNALRKLLLDRPSDQMAWMMSCRLLNADGSEQTAAHRDIMTPWRAAVEIFQLYRLAPQHPYFRRFKVYEGVDQHAVNNVPVISGAFMLLPTRDYRALGGMDEDYFLHVEDIDFCLNFLRQGGKIYYNPKVSVLHHKSTSEVSPLFLEWHKTRGFMHYFRKNFTHLYPVGFIALVNAGVFSRYVFIASALLTRKALQKARTRLRALFHLTD